MKQLLLLFILFPFLSFAQVQIGSDIDGEAADEEFGHSISLSSDGTIVAVGMRSFNGSVRVFNYNAFNGWEQLGSDINPEAEGDRFGNSVSLSSDGTIVAIGAPGNDGNGESSGHVRVYSYGELSGWEQLGNDINGEAGSNIPIDFNGDLFGYSVSLSSDGSIVAIGALYNDGINGQLSGHVRVFNYNGSNWIQIGDDIDGEAASDNSGFRISLSSDGSIIAIGAPFNDGNGQDSGHVRVFNYNGSDWIQIGDDIDGEAATDNSGRSVSISADGSIVAIGATRNGSSESVPDGFGHIRIYKNISNVWTQIGADIDAETEGDRFGHVVSLSSDGSVVAGGTPFNDGNGYNAGHVRVYDLTAVLSTKSFENNYFSFYPNPVKDVLNIDINKGLELKQVNIYTLEGRYLYSVKSKKIETKHLTSGMYVFEVETNEGKSAKKIVVE